MDISSTDCDNLYGLLLAAGASRRLGRPKQLLKLHTETLVERAVRVLTQATTNKVRVVVQNAQAEEDFGLTADVESVFNPNWRDGIGSSVAVGVGSLPKSAEGVLITVVDQPLLTATTLKQLVALWRSDPRKAVACSYRGTMGVPALFPKSFFPQLCGLSGNRGAKSLLTSTGQPLVTLPCDEAALDIDTPADWEALKRRNQGKG